MTRLWQRSKKQQTACLQAANRYHAKYTIYLQLLSTQAHLQPPHPGLIEEGNISGAEKTP